MNNKTQEVSEAFCVNCHNYKEEIDKLLKQQKTEQQISINKLEEIINKMQTNVNNLHGNITKLKNHTEITKSICLAMKILAKIKKCSNLQMDLKLMVCRLFLNFSLFNHAKAAIQKCSVEKVFCDFNRIALQRYGMFSCKFAAYFQSTISQEHL